MGEYEYTHEHHSPWMDDDNYFLKRVPDQPFAYGMPLSFRGVPIAAPIETPKHSATRCKCSPYHKNEFLEPDRILKSKNATVVFWKDGTKTVVKCARNEEPNEYNAFTAALAIKLFGTNSRVKKIIKNKTVIQEKKGKVK